MDIIQLLPEHVANQIAAGEVIQRPASAAKEMIENALDAGSSEIKLIIKDAGKTLIQVVDNGCGMSKNDVRMCFERHATSKINTASDLFNIKSMGFRGEAMASIAAISHVEVKTKLTDQELGSVIIIEGSKVKTHEDSTSLDGTSIKVKNLFYNVPARRNFLKSDSVEMRHIIEEFTRVSLANPNVKMQLYHNNNELFHLQISNFRQRIINIIGEKKNENLVPIEEKTTVVNIKGFIGKPQSARKTRGEQYFFVNKRFIKSHYLHHAVNKAFDDVIPNNYFPSYFINLDIEPKLIDINIHPTKTEIKFDDEQAIYAIIRATVKRSLGEYNIAPSIDFSKEVSFEIDYSNIKNKQIIHPTIKVDSSYNPFDTSSRKKTLKSYSKSDNQQFKLVEEFELENQSFQATQIGEYFLSAANQKGLLIIHQRRAHKRILFEYFMKNLKTQKSQSQKLIFPKIIKLNNNEIDYISSVKKDLKLLGFIIKLNQNNLIINAIPPECQEDNIKPIIEEILEQVKNKENVEIIKGQRLAKSLAESLAINKCKKLEDKEMMSLTKELLKCKTPSVCPSGKRAMVNLKNSDIEKYFKNV